MIPEQLKEMFGLKNQKDLGMANNIWKMLDQMSENDPQSYKKFVQKNVKEGMDDAKVKTQEKEKPYRVKPIPGVCLSMAATLSQKPLDSGINQQVLVTKQPWGQIRVKFAPSIKITLNICHSDRIRDLISLKTKKPVQKFLIQDLKDIQFFYYSLQGPHPIKDSPNIDFCFILNTKFFSDILSQNGGKKILMGLCVSYLQERLANDKNPLLKHYNPEEHRRLAFYSIEKMSFEVRQEVFKYGDSSEVIQFLLEKQVDKKREAEEKKVREKEKKEAELKAKKPEIKFRQEKKEQEPVLPSINLTPEPVKSKKVLIEVLKQQQTKIDAQITYTMKQIESGYSFEFLLPGIASIKQVELQMKQDCIKLRTKDKNELVIDLKKKINEESIKAKFKKAEHMLRVETKFM